MRSKLAKRQYWRMGQKSAQKAPSAELRGSRAMQVGLRRRVRLRLLMSHICKLTVVVSTYCSSQYGKMLTV